MATAQRTKRKTSQKKKNQNVNEVAQNASNEDGGTDSSVVDSGGDNSGSLQSDNGGHGVDALANPSMHSSVPDRTAQQPKVDKTFRAQQWEMMTKTDKSRLNMTREEFLEKDDVTGFGINSYFTPLEERRGIAKSRNQGN